MKKLVLTAILCGGLVFQAQNREQVFVDTSCIEIFNGSLVKNYIDSLGIKHGDVLYAQILIETGGFTSQIFKENNNLCGMRYVDTVKAKKYRFRYRKTTAIGERYKHAVYTTWRQSIYDYYLWQQMFKKRPIECMSKHEYLRFIGSIYAEDTTYLKTIKYVLNELKKPDTSPTRSMTFVWRNI